MAGYLSALPALETKVPDIGPGVNYLANIPNQLREREMESRKMSLLEQATAMKQQEHQFNMANLTREQKLKALDWVSRLADAAPDDATFQRGSDMLTKLFGPDSALMDDDGNPLGDVPSIVGLGGTSVAG